ERGPRVVNRLPTASLSRRREKARRRLATLSTLARVTSGSATRRSSLALGRVVLISSCLNSDAAMLVNIAWRWALVRLNLRPAFWWRMVWIPWKGEGWSRGRLCRLPGVVCGLRMVLAGILRRSCRGLRPVGGYCESRLSEEAAAYAAFAPPARRSAPGVHTPQPMPEGIGWARGAHPSMPWAETPAGGQFSSFMPSDRPRWASTSLISVSDFFPRFGVLSSSTSVFWIRSPM